MCLAADQDRLLQNPNQFFFSALKTGFSALRFLRSSPIMKILIYVGSRNRTADNPVLSAEKTIDLDFVVLAEDILLSLGSRIFGALCCLWKGSKLDLTF